MGLIWDNHGINLGLNINNSFYTAFILVLKKVHNNGIFLIVYGNGMKVS